VATLGSDVAFVGGGVTLGGSASFVASVCTHVIPGGVVSLSKMCVSLLIESIVSFVTSWNGVGRGGSFRAVVRFVAAMTILSVWVGAGELYFVGKNLL
jgi:hypothetical protein